MAKRFLSVALMAITVLVVATTIFVIDIVVAFQPLESVGRNGQIGSTSSVSRKRKHDIKYLASLTTGCSTHVSHFQMKPVGNDDDDDARQDKDVVLVQNNKVDAAEVLLRLREGGMSIAMVTGDALLTAIHVAKEVDIIESIAGKTDEDYLDKEQNEELKAFIETKRNGKSTKTKKSIKEKKEFKPILLLEQSKNGSLFWENYETGSKVEDFNPSLIPLLSQKYDLATTGKSLSVALLDETTKSTLGYFKVFARMTPDAKETVIECLHSVGSLCLMCGDGANDVGALKGADVGVALLTGFGDINVDKTDEESQKNKDENISKETISALLFFTQ